MYSTFLTTLAGTSIFLRKKSSELVNSKANKREGSGRYKLKTTSYLKAEHTYEAESADHAVQLRPWFCRVFPRGTLGKEKWHWKIETLKQSLAFLEKSCCVWGNFLKNILAFPSDTNVNFAVLYLIAPIHHQCFLCSWNSSSKIHNY